MNSRQEPVRGSLKGVTIIDLSRLLPGPYGTMILADHGARVIAVEEERYRTSGHFVTPLYRNKEHICLNLKDPQGLAVFEELVRRADVLVEGFRPGVARKLGVDYEAVRQVREDIIYCSLSGFGQSGPYQGRAGHDVNYQALTGALALNGAAGGAPIIPGIQIADMAGGVHTAMGVLLALIARQTTGKGQYIDISMSDATLAMLPLAYFFRDLSGQDPARGDNLLSHRYACYNVYETSDGRHVSIGALEAVFWRNLCRYLDMPQYADLQYDEARRLEILMEVRRRFREKPLAQWVHELQDADVCFAPVQSLSEAAQDPHFTHREMIRVDRDAAGLETHTLGIPIKLGRTPGSLRTGAAAFGQHTDAVLKELGYSEKQIMELKKWGAAS